MIGLTTLAPLVSADGIPESVRKRDLGLGDRLIVETRNSVYRIVSLGDGRFVVEGGWFDRRGLSRTTTTINGCTWGGSAIHTGLAAGHGMFLEFGNHVVTTRILGFRLIRCAESSVAH